MYKHMRLCFLSIPVLFVVVSFAVSTAYQTAVASNEKPTEKPIVISIKGMQCQGCANKVTYNIKKVPGVGKVSVSAKTATAKVIPADRSEPSPRALWLAVKKTGYKPVKLVCRLGTFTKIPKR